MRHFVPIRSVSEGAATALTIETPPLLDISTISSEIATTMQLNLPISAGQSDWVEVPSRPHNVEPVGPSYKGLYDKALKSASSTGKTQGSGVGPFLRRSLHKWKKHDCVICLCPIEGAAVLAPCGHYYDTACLLDLVQASTRDESLFPPRCCTHIIPAALFEPLLSKALSTLFWEKSVEYSTPARVYCANAPCSRFLGPRTPRSSHGHAHTYTCADCNTRTCSRCCAETKKHLLHACRPDTTSQMLLESAQGRAAGWVRCPGCARVVELQSGCFHVTCLCRTQFCYRCAAPWKTCACPWWDARRGAAPATSATPASARSPVPLPVLPPVPRHARMRETWIHAPRSPLDAPAGISPGVASRRVRASAPAELQPRIPAHDSLLVRGVYAQERRRGKHDAAGDDRGQTRENGGFTIDSGHPDALEEQIDRLIRVVEQYPCRHEWRIAEGQNACDLCKNISSASFRCAKCTSCACTRCKVNKD